MLQQLARLSSHILSGSTRGLPVQELFDVPCQPTICIVREGDDLNPKFVRFCPSHDRLINLETIFLARQPELNPYDCLCKRGRKTPDPKPIE